MKKSILATLIALLVSFNLMAQKKGDVEVGFNIGFNNSSVSDSQYSYDSSTGLNIGGSLDYYFSRDWSLKVKMIYDQKGWDNDVILNLDDGQYYPTDYNLDYLTIPVMANWHFGNKREWYLNFGPYLGFLMSAKDTQFDADMKKFFNTTDFGLAAGIGVKIPISDKLKFFAEIEGQGGFTDINKESGYPSLTNSRSSINVGFNFLLK
ncbi:PorT family protein [Flavobacterium sp. AS60]|uniref:porin family protein n=1 Tax=Flavobacterium anseongense TaxID=2910677 RepID=UPI001F266500|nr:porin family protein [Flavobacterium sp. AS60]MCF6128645.1 PorT family protein [Flavobacterium sp. AS60]